MLFRNWIGWASRDDEYMPDHRGVSQSVLFVGCIRTAVALSTLLACSMTTPATAFAQPIYSATAPNITPAAVDSEPIYLQEELVSMNVYEQCNRSVVHIATKSVGVGAFSQLKLREGTGSGSVLDLAGHVLTNYHVVEGARKVTVSLYNGLSYPAELVGQDPDTDIAVLKIDAPTDHLHPLAFGSSEQLRVGQRIYAIGNPFGLERTMSTGMISSLDRQIPSKTGRSIRSLIQLDATLNQGNSGGPLLNTRGQLVGMNTAIISSDGDSAGVGFAIPASTIQRIVLQLIEHGKVIRASIGISRVYESDKGLLIVSLVAGGPAEAAGLKGFQLVKQVKRQGLFQVEHSYYDLSAADLILAVEGQKVDSADHFLSLIETRRPGEVVPITIIRGGTEMTVPVRLGNS
ncbi:MAG: trypsin-like peptidase domain-containing protein [Pirellulaceae bacterium]|nr:trypsin-like peptidase domain-containing protein [Pirellulaceae bacterium]